MKVFKHDRFITYFPPVAHSQLTAVRIDGVFLGTFTDLQSAQEAAEAWCQENPIPPKGPTLVAPTRKAPAR